MIDPSQENTICPSCHTGQLKVVMRPLLRVINDQLFTIPNAFCYQCELCEFQEFDESMIQLITTMIDHTFPHSP